MLRNSTGFFYDSRTSQQLLQKGMKVSFLISKCSSYDSFPWNKLRSEVMRMYDYIK